MKGKDILKGLTEAQRPVVSKTRPQPTRTSGSVRSLKSELDKIAGEAAMAKELKEAIAKEGRIIDLDPQSVDGASIVDRIPVQQDEQFETLKTAIAESGQQVPILVRPSPNDSDRYEAAYGHRRLRATAELGIKVKAIVRSLSDDEMVRAQGQENGPRLDLSFIERATYTAKLLNHGYDKDLVCQAIGVDKPELSRLKKVAEAISPDVILAIGPARKIGRPRWLALAEAFESRVIELNTVVQSDAFSEIADSNSRFEYLLKSLEEPRKIKTAEPKHTIKGASNLKVGWIQKTPRGAAIAIQDKEFTEFLRKRLPELVNEFEQLSGAKE